MKTRFSLSLRILPVALALALAVACTKPPNDTQVTSEIQSKLGADSGLQNKQITVQSDKGTVTLSGAVDNDAEREAAAKYAASEPGVKTVINNLQVGTAEAIVKPSPESAPNQTVQKPKPPRARTTRREEPQMQADNSPAPPADQPAPPSPDPAAQQPAAPPPPPQL